jgi:hypothetical protein
MTLFSAAAAAALDRPDNGLKPGLYSYVTELEFNVKNNGHLAPSIVVQTLAKFVLDDADIVFVDGTRQCITFDDFPTSKASFDDVFCITTANGKLSCKIEMQSNHSSFHEIKIGVWDILQNHQESDESGQENYTRRHWLLVESSPRICKCQSLPHRNHTGHGRGDNKSFIGSEGPFRLAIPSTGGKSVLLGVVAPP